MTHRTDDVVRALTFATLVMLVAGNVAVLWHNFRHISLKGDSAVTADPSSDCVARLP